MDRTKDKSVAPAAAKRAVAPVLDAGEVATYLRQHAGFLADHPDLLHILTPPAQ